MAQVEITNGVSPILTTLAQIHRDSALEQMSKIGDAVRKNARNQMTMPRNRHHWFQKLTREGKRTPYKDENATKELGYRTMPDGSPASPDSMKATITSHLSEKSATLVVGGMHKKGQMLKRRDGQVVGALPLFAVSRATWSILNKLDQGERNSDHTWGGLRKSMPNFANAKYVRRDFMRKGFADSIGYMNEQLGSAYERLVGQAINKVQVRIKPTKEKVS